MKEILNLNKQAWDKIAKQYNERIISGPSETFIDFTKKLLPNSLILDLGCGTGIPHDRYLVENGFNVIGIDFSSEMVKVASSNVPEGTFIQLSMTDIDYKTEFNGILSSFSLLLLSPDLFKETAIRIHSALKTGGYFYMSLNEPPNESNNPDSDVFVNIMGQDMYSRAYSVEEVENIFLPLGFSVINFNRVIHLSEEFGEEHVLEYVLQKC